MYGNKGYWNPQRKLGLAKTVLNKCEKLFHSPLLISPVDYQLKFPRSLETAKH